MSVIRETKELFKEVVPWVAVVGSILLLIAAFVGLMVAAFVGVWLTEGCS